MAMDAERWRIVERLFHGALDAPPARRGEFLARECGGDAALRAEVERLLEIDGQEVDVVARYGVLPARDVAIDAERPDPLVGRVIGAYRLVKRIAAGGMGVVYRGERADGLFVQDVAVKLVRGEVPDETALRRFDLERRTLASLNHANIARLYDGGTTTEGTPYLVMEYVDGLAIDAWCTERRLTVDERLRLFAEVARAVHFAHQNLVVHGDLKPPNLLVDAQGTVKLLDFGIARLMEGSESRDGTERTLTMARLMTPEYASPEQWRGEPLTTAADVYSLGVVLHVLLTGRKPFRAAGLSAGEWERTVSEREPTRPSARVKARTPIAEDEPTTAAFAEACGTTPARLAWTLRGDVDRIVLQALRKDPARRYASALALAEDVERHLRGLPVHAREESYGYRLWSFVRRNRLVVAAAALVVLGQSFALYVSLKAEKRAQSSATHARIEAESFRRMAELSLDALLATKGQGDVQRQATLRATVVAQADHVRRQYADQRHLQANLLDALGLFCLRTGAADDEAATLLREAQQLRELEFDPASLEHALSLRSLAELETHLGHGEAAVELLERALALHRRSNEVHTDVAQAATELATALRAVGRREEAQALYLEALGIRRERIGPRSLPVADELEALAGVLVELGEREAAVAHLEEALSIRQTLLGDADVETARTRAQLAEARSR